MNVSDKILEVLKASAKPLKSGEIAEETGLNKVDVDKAIKSLINNGTVISPKRCYYELKNT